MDSYVESEFLIYDRLILPKGKFLPFGEVRRGLDNKSKVIIYPYLIFTQLVVQVEKNTVLIQPVVSPGTKAQDLNVHRIKLKKTANIRP